MTVQSVRFTADADAYSRSATGLGATDFTICGWFKLSADINNYVSFFSVGDTGNYVFLGTDSDGTTLRYIAGTDENGFGALTVGTWYFLALVWTTSSGTNQTIYYAAEGSSTLTSGAGGGSDALTNSHTFYIGHSPFAGRFNGSAAQVKVWDTVLSQAELEAEMYVDSVVKTAGLWAYYSFRHGTQGNDESGNGRTLSLAGTVLNEDGPASVVHAAPLTAAADVRSVGFGTLSNYSVPAAALNGTDLTWSFWVNFAQIAQQALMGVDNAGSEYFNIGVYPTGQLIVASNSIDLGTGHIMQADVWYFITIVHHESSGAMEFYYATADDPTLTRCDLTGSIGPTSAGSPLRIAGDGYGFWLPGRMMQVKVWDAALTEAEVEDEMPFEGVARTADLWGYWSFHDGPQTLDESGNGRTLTGTVPSGGATYGCAGPGSATSVILTDTWTGTDTNPWDTTKWPVQRNGSDVTAGSYFAIDTNSGKIFNGHTGGSGHPTALTEISATDFELLVKRTGTNNGYPEIGWRVTREIADTGNPDAGYAIQLAGTTVTLHAVNGYAGIGSGVADGALSGTTTTWWRIRVVGSHHKIRWWIDGGAEPSTWQIEVSDSYGFEGGRFYLANWGGGNTHYYDDLTITDLSGIVGSEAAGWDTGGGYAVGNSVLVASDFTIAGWFYLDPDSGNSPLWGADDGGSNYWLVYCGYPTAQLAVERNSGAYNTSHLIERETWYYIGTTYTASTGVTTFRITPDGGSPTSYTSSTGNGIASGTTLRINCDNFGAASKTQQAAVKIWDAVLSAGELDAEMVSYDVVRTADLFAHYPFNELPYTTDHSGNGHTLTPYLAVPHRVQGPQALNAAEPEPEPSTMFLYVTRSTLVS